MSPLRPTRREFLAATVAPFGARSFLPSSQSLPITPRNRAARATTYLPDGTAVHTLRQLALAAVDAAKSAGATYADVRLMTMRDSFVSLGFVGDRPTLFSNTSSDFAPAFFPPRATFDVGVRAMVGGATSFAYSERPTIDAVTEAAKHATASARGLAGHLRMPLEMVHAPVATGEWETPIRIDPFGVPLEEQVDLLASYDNVVRRIKNGSVSLVGTGFVWYHKIVVVATTEGTLVTQGWRYGGLFQRVQGRQGVSIVELDGGDDRLPIRAGGYELMLDPAGHDRIMRRTEEAVRLASYPPSVLDVGRYELVTGGGATGHFLGSLVGAALESDRALGYEAGVGSGSYLGPPSAVLGQQLFSPTLQLSSSRLPSAPNGAQWDYEGVESTCTPLIERGRIIDYVTTRATASALRSWYERSNMPVQSNGNAGIATAINVPLPSHGHLIMAPDAGGPATIDALCAGVSHGVLLYDPGPMSVDAQLSSAFMLPSALMFEIRRGAIVGRLMQNGLQLRSRNMWGRSLKQIGGARTIGYTFADAAKSQLDSFSVEAPAAHFVDVDVTRTGVE